MHLNCQCPSQFVHFYICFELWHWGLFHLTLRSADAVHTVSETWKVFKLLQNSNCEGILIVRVRCTWTSQANWISVQVMCECFIMTKYSVTHKARYDHYSSVIGSIIEDGKWLQAKHVELCVSMISKLWMTFQLNASLVFWSLDLSWCFLGWSQN